MSKSKFKECAAVGVVLALIIAAVILWQKKESHSSTAAFTEIVPEDDSLSTMDSVAETETETETATETETKTEISNIRPEMKKEAVRETFTARFEKEEKEKEEEEEEKESAKEKQAATEIETVLESMPESKESPEEISSKQSHKYPVQLTLDSSFGFRTSSKMSTSASQASPELAMPQTGVTELGDISYGLPFSIGLGVKFYILPRLALGSGIYYSLLTKSFEGEYLRVNQHGDILIDEKGHVRNAMHYVGIPLNLYFDILPKDRFRLYLHAGGEADYCIANIYTISLSPTYQYSKPVSTILWSAGAGLGMEYSICKRLGLYIDPAVTWYSNSNIRFNINAGLRFSL